MYNGHWGHVGKTGYLRQPLNILGLQETRTPEGLSCAEDVLRLNTGCDNGQGGLELWVHLGIPFAFLNNQPICFRKSDFQVLHKDPHTSPLPFPLLKG